MTNPGLMAEMARMRRKRQLKGSTRLPPDVDAVILRRVDLNGLSASRSKSSSVAVINGFAFE